MSASQRHNDLTKEVIGLIGGRTRTMPELMVVVESLLLATMLLLVRLYGKRPSDASALVEASLQRANERFAEKNHGR